MSAVMIEKDNEINFLNGSVKLFKKVVESNVEIGKSKVNKNSCEYLTYVGQKNDKFYDVRR
jgi:hypothetical protein